MKRFFTNCIVVLIILATCFSVACNTTAISEEEKVEFETAYLQYLNEKNDFYTGVELVKYAGEYDGNKVAVFRWVSNDIMVTENVIDYIVDDVLVCVLPNHIYDIIVYTADKEIKDLQTAYSEGIISRKDLLSIKSKFQNIVY